MFFFAIPILSTLLETVATVVVTTVVSEMASDAYHALTTNDNHEEE
jgi:hypothetical protein